MLKIPVEQYLKDLAAFTWVQTHHHMSRADTNICLVKADPALFFGVIAFNVNAATRYLKLYNTSVLPLAGSTPVARTIAIPPNSLVNVSFASPALFDKGLAFSLNTGISDSSSTSIAADDIVIDIAYR